MNKKDIFLTVVVVVRNQASALKEMISNIADNLKIAVSDYEIIIVDNASTDDSFSALKELTSIDGLANLQVYMLTKEVDIDTATWAGLEPALGDFMVVFDPLLDDLSVLHSMLELAVDGSDVVFATNLNKPHASVGYRIGNAIFNYMYKNFSGINLVKDAPTYRILSRRVINFISQHLHPETNYRYLPATSGFIKKYVEYESLQQPISVKKVGNSIQRGIQLITSTTAPMRIVTILSLFGAVANLLYSFYVVLIGIFLENVAAGWVSMSLQMSGMFFLISLVLLVLGEYILRMTQFNSGGPAYHVGQELTSAQITRLNKLNIEAHSILSQK